MSGSLRGTLETILVVDDNESVLNLVVTVLQRANFRVLSAGSGPHAIELCDRTDETIHMLLSDIDMPEMSGPDLGQELKKARPDLHVMLMSGNANGNLLVLNYGWAFIQKPFVPVKLVQMVTSVLHSPDRSQLGGQEFDSLKDTSSRIPCVVTPHHEDDEDREPASGGHPQPCQAAHEPL